MHLIITTFNLQTMIDLARLHLQVGDLDACQQYCMQALRSSVDGSDQASMVGAHLQVYCGKFSIILFNLFIICLLVNLSSKIPNQHIA